MKILISNDDGINSIGILALSKELSKYHEVYIIAPDRERSATSHSLTLHSPIRVKELDNSNFGAKRVWTTSGTPGDCIKLGISTILSDSEKPDIIVSGINHGPNLGHDVRYSGTVSAALEASMLGFPAIAVSLVAIDAKYEDFITPAKKTVDIINRFNNINSRTVLNINFPKIAEKDIQGYAITQLAQRIFTSQYDKRLDPQGREYYWLAGVPAHDPQNAPTDLDAIRKNKISITPLCYDMTNHEIIPQMSTLIEKQPI